MMCLKMKEITHEKREYMGIHILWITDFVYHNLLCKSDLAGQQANDDNRAAGQA